MSKRPIIKLIVYGLLQWILLNISLFLGSLIYGIKEGAEMSLPPPLGLVIAAVIMVIVAYLFCRRLKPVSRKQAITAGLLWSGMTTVFTTVTVFGNGTQDVVFGSWAMYLLLVAQAVGSMFVSVKKTDVGNSLPTI